MNRRSVYVLSTICLLAIAQPSTAQMASSQKAAVQAALSANQTSDDDRRDQFSLYTQCGRLDFLSALMPLAEELGLTTSSIDAVAVELLENASVYSDEPSRAFASVHVIGIESGAYATQLRFWKLVDDGTYTETLGWAPTWMTQRLSTAPSSQTILSDISDLVQYFVAEYLRINDEACNPPTNLPAVASTTAECYRSSVTSPAPLMGQTDEVIELLDGSRWEVGIGHYNYLYAYYPNVVVCPASGIMMIRNVPRRGQATELQVTKP